MLAQSWIEEAWSSEGGWDKDRGSEDMVEQSARLPRAPLQAKREGLSRPSLLENRVTIAVVLLHTSVQYTCITASSLVPLFTMHGQCA